MIKFSDKLEQLVLQLPQTPVLWTPVLFLDLSQFDQMGGSHKVLLTADLSVAKVLNRPRSQLFELSSKLWQDPVVCHNVLRVGSGRHDKRGADHCLNYNIILQRTCSRARSAVITMRLDTIRLDCSRPPASIFLWWTYSLEDRAPNLVLDSRRNNSTLIGYF